MKNNHTINFRGLKPSVLTVSLHERRKASTFLLLTLESMYSLFAFIHRVRLDDFLHANINHKLLTVNCRQSLPGQALVTLLVFASIATIITAAAVTVTIINSQTTSKFAIGDEALFVAEAGVENIVLKLLRNPTYSGSPSSEVITIGNGQATVDVSGNPTVTIISTGTVNDFIRKIQVTATYSNNQFAITSWQTIN